MIENIELLEQNKIEAETSYIQAIDVKSNQLNEARSSGEIWI